MSLPIEAGVWKIDHAHSTVEFTVKHLGLANVRGRFDSFDAKITAGDDLDVTSVWASVALDSVNTNNTDRDNHLLGTDFFDTSKNPTLTFHSTAVHAKADEYVVVGDLAINGITRTVELVTEFNGSQTNPFTQATHIGFSATGEIKRSDYGIDFQVPLGGDKFLVSDKVKIALELEFVKA